MGRLTTHVLDTASGKPAGRIRQKNEQAIIQAAEDEFARHGFKGTSMNTIMTKDMTRAIAAPACPSRTMAIDTMRGDEAPKPWMNRPTRIIGKL